MYTKDEIESIIRNTFTTHIEDVKCVDENGGNYKFYVYIDVYCKELDMNVLGKNMHELYDSGLFDITFTGNRIDIEYLNPGIMDSKQFRYFNENINNWISFDDAQIKGIKQRFNSLHERYRKNKFFETIMASLDKNKKLSQKQFNELSFLMKNGKTRYEANVLSTKN